MIMAKGVTSQPANLESLSTLVLHNATRLRGAMARLILHALIRNLANHGCSLLPRTTRQHANLQILVGIPTFAPRGKMRFPTTFWSPSLLSVKLPSVRFARYPLVPPF